MSTNNYTKLTLSKLIPTTESPRFNFQEPITGPILLSNSMQMIVFENNWFGISAPQVGFNTRAIYIRGMESAMFNPVVVDTSEKQVYLDEISPQYPGMVIRIKRPELVRVRSTDALGNTTTNIFSGLTARTILRKIDFLDGVDLLSRATKYHRDRAKRNKVSERTTNDNERVSGTTKPDEVLG